MKRLLFAFLIVASHLPLMGEIAIETYQQEHIVPLLPMLNAWGERAFSAYPYLLCSPKEQIICPSDLVFVNNDID